MKTLAKLLIRIYTHGISPLLPRSCRFYPTCSHYTYKAIETHGTLKGGWLGLKRICKCHPYYKGDFHDPVPDAAPLDDMQMKDKA